VPVIVGPNCVLNFIKIGGFEPLNIVDGHSNPQKALPLVTTRHLSHKWLNSVQGFDLGEVVRKKSITRTGQDRTTKSHKSVIFDIFGGKLPIKILQCNLA